MSTNQLPPFPAALQQESLPPSTSRFFFLFSVVAFTAGAITGVKNTSCPLCCHVCFRRRCHLPAHTPALHPEREEQDYKHIEIRNMHPKGGIEALVMSAATRLCFNGLFEWSKRLGYTDVRLTRIHSCS